MGKLFRTLITLAVIFLSLIRLFFLDADPPSQIVSSVVGDEGYWVHNARLSELFGRAFTDDFVEDVTVAPLLSLLLRISFGIFGVGFWQARLVPAVFGVGSIWFLWLLLKKEGRQNALVCSLILSSNWLFFTVNRLVMGESIAIFFVLLSYLLIIRRRFYWAGFAWGLAVLAKSNAVFIWLGLAVTWLIFQRISVKELIKITLAGLSVVLGGFEFVSSMTGRSILLTYTQLSGTDYIPRGFEGLVGNIKQFIKNIIWRRQGLWLLVLPVCWKLLAYGKKVSVVSELAVGLIIGQGISVAVLSNQGSDHRFAFLILGIIILFSRLPKELVLIVGVLFAIWQWLFIGDYLLHRTYTLRDESREIGGLADQGAAITGFFSHELSLENKLYPLYWAPGHEKFKLINQDARSFRPSLLLQTVVVDGRDGNVFTSQEQLNLGEEQKIISEIKALPIKRSKTHQIELKVRSITW